MTQYDVELIDVTKEFPARRQDGLVRAVDNVSLQIAAGEFFALLGPSGCGKTTTLRMIAGFEDTTSGQILIRGSAVQHIPPFHRPVNTVFQDYALFPHMTVIQNIMFGLEMEGVNKQEARKRAIEALELVRLPQVTHRKPRQLSGGQQQRVALARALVKKPAVLLLDEPLGALDLKLRQAMQYELKTMQKSLGITFIFVTHDQEEAMTMADRIAVMDQGKVLQVGKPEEIYETPATKFVADFIGETNFIKGQIGEIGEQFVTVQLNEQTRIKAAASAELSLSAGQQVTVALRPEKINLFQVKGTIEYEEGSTESAESYKAALLRDPNINLIRGTVKQAIYIGTDTRYVLTIPGNQDVVARIQNFGLRSDTVFEPGDTVNMFWNAENGRVLLQ
ncbi:MAG: ABC transporter ATP-binding protein [Anaerolineaceae bacterium]|nr:ABC transporter ATP-binding protein [Anaerolineaceae bacterium]